MKYRIKSDLRKGGIVFDVSQVLEEVEDGVPPGILSFKGIYTGKIHYNETLNPYEFWVGLHLNHEPKSAIHSIRVGDEVWTLGDIIENKHEKGAWCHGVISEFSYIGRYWFVRLGTNTSWHDLSYCKKSLPIETPTLESRVKAIEDEQKKHRLAEIAKDISELKSKRPKYCLTEIDELKETFSGQCILELRGRVKDIEDFLSNFKK